MKLITGILLTAIAAGAASAQNPDIIQNTKNTVNAVAKKAELDQNAALQAAGVPNKPPAGTSARTAAVPNAPKAIIAAPKPAVTSAKTVTSSSKLGVAAAKPAVVKTTAGSTQPKVSTVATSSSKSAAAVPAKKAPATKIAIAPIVAQPKQGAQKTNAPAHKPVPKQAKAEPAKPDKTEQTVAGNAENEPAPAAADAPKEKKTITAEGRRDPFISPVVSRSNGPNCSTGKRCLAIDQILVRGVVKADTGMIAVVVNSLNKAYFLKENDPVYNGYVMRITGDSVVFKETFQDRLGKESTREVVKKITTPAV
jgi:hypothetical protein